MRLVIVVFNVTIVPSDMCCNEYDCNFTAFVAALTLT